MKDKPDVLNIKSHLVFAIENEEYAINAAKVQRILEMQAITKFPNMPSFIRGVINLMGKPLPVFSVRRKLGLAEIEDTRQTCIIVLEIMNNNRMLEVAVVVDTVRSVLEIEMEEILSTPDFSINYDIDIIQGVVENENSFLMVLDVDKLFSTNEIIDIKKSIEVLKVDQEVSA